MKSSMFETGIMIPEGFILRVRKKSKRHSVPLEYSVMGFNFSSCYINTVISFSLDHLI